MIVEFKAESIDSPTKKIFDEYGMMPSKPCSKYCLGNYFLGNVQKRSRFVPTIATIKSIVYSDAKVTKKLRAYRQLKRFQKQQLKSLIQYK